MDCPQASSSWGEMMERVSPVLPLLFEDPLTGEEDDGDEDAILRPPSAQEVCRRAVDRLAIPTGRSGGWKRFVWWKEASVTSPSSEAVYSSRPGLHDWNEEVLEQAFFPPCARQWIFEAGCSGYGGFGDGGHPPPPPPPLSNNLWQITCTQVAGQRSLQPEPNCQGKQSVSPPLFFKRSVNHLHWLFVLYTRRPSLLPTKRSYKRRWCISWTLDLPTQCSGRRYESLQI